MARNRFGGAAATFVVDPGGQGETYRRPRVDATHEAGEFTFWTGTPADSGRAQYDDLRVLNDLVTVQESITALANGDLPEFYGPDDATVTAMWGSVDGGANGVWILANRFHPVAGSGDYDDLENTPAIPVGASDSEATAGTDTAKWMSSARVKLVVDAAVTALKGGVSSTYDSLGKVATKLGAIDTALGTKADLVGGKIPTSQIPSISTHETVPVANKAAMLALTTSQVQPGDVVVIGSSAPKADRGLWLLAGTDPTTLSNWTHLDVQTGVVSVNGQDGTIVLAPADVGAEPALTAPGSGAAGKVLHGDKTWVDLATDPALIAAYAPVTEPKATHGAVAMSIALGGI